MVFLILANGGVLTYQHILVLSTSPRLHHDRAPYPSTSPLPLLLSTPPSQIGSSPEEEAQIKTYTIDYDRFNRPKLGHVVGRMKRNDTASWRIMGMNAR